MIPVWRIFADSLAVQSLRSLGSYCKDTSKPEKAPTEFSPTLTEDGWPHNSGAVCLLYSKLSMDRLDQTWELWYQHDTDALAGYRGLTFCFCCGVGLRIWDDLLDISNNFYPLCTQRINTCQLWSLTSVQWPQDFTGANLCVTAGCYCVRCLSGGMTAHMTWSFNDVGDSEAEPGADSCHTGIVFGLGILGDNFDILLSRHRDVQTILNSYQGWKFCHEYKPLAVAITGCNYSGNGRWNRCLSSVIEQRFWKMYYVSLERVRWRYFCDNVRLSCGELSSGEHAVYENRTGTNKASKTGAAINLSTSIEDAFSDTLYPQYSGLQNREDNYHDKAHICTQDPQFLAPAGFFCSGYRDCVRCFYCGEGLRTWEKEDDPWVEHVSWKSSCDYVRCMKGEQFVLRALAGGETDPRRALLSGTFGTCISHPEITSYTDCVRCFFCGVGARTWEKEDDPWVEHVRWRSSCDYVRCMKGEQFVIKALAEDNDLQTQLSSAASTQVTDEIHSSQVTLCGNVPEKTLQVHQDNKTEHLYYIRKLYSPLCGVDLMPCQKYETEMKPSKVYDFMDKNHYLSSVQPIQSLVACPLASLRTFFEDIAAGGYPDLEERYEAFRLQSYSRVHVDSSPIRLAAAGFYATGDEDETKCYSCGTTKRDWQKGDNPFEVHRTISPDCTHVSGRDRRNVPIHSTATCTWGQEEQGRDVLYSEGTNRQFGLQMSSSFDHRQDYSLGDSRSTTSADRERRLSEININFVDNNNSSRPLASNTFMTARVITEEQERESFDEIRDGIEVFEDTGATYEVTLGNSARLSQVSEERRDDI